jgi:hypothetical protein
VTIEAVSVDTNAVRSAVSGRDGQYVIPLVPPGVDNVKATLVVAPPGALSGQSVVNVVTKSGTSAAATVVAACCSDARMIVDFMTTASLYAALHDEPSTSALG